MKEKKKTKKVASKVNQETLQRLKRKVENIEHRMDIAMGLIDNLGNSTNSIAGDIETLSNAVDAILGPLIDKYIQRRKAELDKEKTKTGAANDMAAIG